MTLMMTMLKKKQVSIDVIPSKCNPPPHRKSAFDLAMTLTFDL